MQADPSSFVQADLRFLVPIHSGQVVAVLGDSPELALALEEEQIQTIMISLPEKATEIPLQNSSVDHILVPLLGRHPQRWFTYEIGRVLRPNGWVFLGMRNAYSLQRLTFWKTGNLHGHAPALSLRHFYKNLERSGFTDISSFGVSRDLVHPEFLIPLERSAASNFFFQRIYSPYSLSAAAAQKVATWITSAGLQRILFKDVLVLARRQMEGAHA